MKWLTPVLMTCNAISLTTLLQKCGGGGCDIRAAVADDKFSPQLFSATISAWKQMNRLKKRFDWYNY